MNKYLLFLIVLFTFKGSIAQQPAPTMELRENGFSGADSTKNYVVIEVPKVSKADLYKKTLTFINGLYNDPQHVVTTVDGESLTVNAKTDAIHGVNPSYKYPTSYSIVIEFKEGKIKFAPKILEFSEIWAANRPPSKYYVSGKDSPTPSEVNCIWIFDKNDKRILFNPELKVSFDRWVNNCIAGIQTKVNDTW
jgi:hypothetical protein